MPTYTMDMVLKYAKVFEGEIDLGDADSGEKWLRDLAKSGGRASVDAYFTSEDQIQQIVEDGFERMALNPKTKSEVDRIKDGDPDFGIGKFIQLRRNIHDVREYVDKSGKVQTLDLGGYPKVVDLRDLENKRLWSKEEDGLLGHGTKAKVQFEIYKKNTVRLIAIGVTELVPFEEVIRADDELFMVD